MRIKKLISLLMALALVCGGMLAGVCAEIGPEALERLASDVVDAENRAHAGEAGAIDAVEITDLDAPRAGRAFDTLATIVGTRPDGAEAVSWQTPVIWTELSGSPADVARAGVTYMPFITFFVPGDYTLADVDVQNNVNITLPGFFADATGKNGTLYFLEAPTSGLVFITGEITVPGKTATAREGDKRISSSDVTAENLQTARPEPGATLRPELMAHTNAETVAHYGPKYVERLIETVKNVIEPRAVNMLIDAFPVYRDALNRGRFSGGIGFFVEKQQNTIAYVRCASLVYKDSGNLAGKAMRVVVNADFFAEWDAEKGEYRFNESRRADLEFTITHEILHATMYDLTPNGTLGVDAGGAKAPGNRFPTWFTEGAATTVDNAYRYRRNELLRLCLDLDRYESENVAAVSFSPDRLIANYRRMAGMYDINGGADGAEYAYTSGYLAAMYLMQLASEHLHGEGHVAGRDAYYSGDMREGFNYILGELTDGRSLDQIIRAISPTDAGGSPVYAGLAEFQARFLAEGDRDYSAAFCASFLKYLESLNQNGQHSWGCILIDFDDMRETLFTDGDAPVEPLAYRIEDAGGYVKSDVPVADTLSAGGATLPGEGGDASAGLESGAAEPEGDALAAKDEAVAETPLFPDGDAGDAAPAPDDEQPDDADVEIDAGSATPAEGGNGTDGAAAPDDGGDINDDESLDNIGDINDDESLDNIGDINDDESLDDIGDINDEEYPDDTGDIYGDDDYFSDTGDAYDEEYPDDTGDIYGDEEYPDDTGDIYGDEEYPDDTGDIYGGDEYFDDIEDAYDDEYFSDTGDICGDNEYPDEAGDGYGSDGYFDGIESGGGEALNGNESPSDQADFSDAGAAPAAREEPPAADGAGSAPEAGEGPAA